MHILLLEDDPVLADILVDFLQESYEVTHAYSMQEALRLADEKVFDLYLFDINVPDGNGITLLKKLRNFNDETPVIFITAFQGTDHLKAAFHAGGDDFIRKPFELEELMLRIENIKRHFGLDTQINLTSTLLFDPQTHTLLGKEGSRRLSTKENACLHYLYQNRRRVVSSEELLHTLWSYEEMPSEDAVRTLIKQLRRLIGKEHIINIRGEGYRYE